MCDYLRENKQLYTTKNQLKHETVLLGIFFIIFKFYVFFNFILLLFFAGVGGIGVSWMCVAFFNFLQYITSIPFYVISLVTC